MVIIDEKFVDEIIKRKQKEIKQLEKTRDVRHEVFDSLLYLNNANIDEAEKNDLSTKLKGILLEIDELLATY